MEFDLEDKALEFIKQNGNSAVIDLKFVHCVGDALCASRRLLGSHVPAIRPGEPGDAETGPYEIIRDQGTILYYHQQLERKVDFKKIRVICRKLFWWKWLELEGAKVIPVFNDYD